MMEIISTTLTTLFSVLALFILTKLMGVRQMSQLSLFDYIIGITIGNAASDMAMTAGDDFLAPLVTMIVYAFVAVFCNMLSDKSLTISRAVSGRPLILMYNGKLYKKNLKKARFDLGEFMVQCRIGGFFDLNQIDTAILETNGHISFLPKTQYRPTTPDDLHLDLPPASLFANVILDGKIVEANLHHIGKNEVWLKSELKKQGYSDYTQIFLATCNTDNTLRIYPKNETPVPKEYLS